VNLLSILTGCIKARVCDWAIEGKSGAGDFREAKTEKEEGDEEMKEAEEVRGRKGRKKIEKYRWP
jgi:hypothetical protein